MKKILKLSIPAVVLILAFSNCKKSYESNSLQPMLDSLAKITTIRVNNVTLGTKNTEGLSRAYALAPNVGYPQWSFSGAASSIDIVFDDAKLWSKDPSGLSKLTDSKARFGTTSLTSAQFESLQSRDDIYKQSGSLAELTIAAGQVVYCQTKDGHKSVILIKSISDNGDTLRLDYKIDVFK